MVPAPFADSPPLPLTKPLTVNVSPESTLMGDEEFLSAYYTRLRGRLEGRLLFGVRRRDKYEKV